MNKAILVVTLAVAAQATAGVSRYNFHSTGNTSFAAFSSSDECLERNLTVSVGASTQNGAGGPSQSTVVVFFAETNNCTGEVTGFFGSAPAPSYRQSGFLSASLNETLTATDFSGANSFPVTVSLQWTGVGSMRHFNSHDTYHQPPFIEISNFNGTSRDAAVTGSILVDGQDFTAGQTSVGGIFRSAQTTVQIQIL